MWILEWLKRRVQSPAPEEGYVVSFDGETISVRHSGGEQVLAVSELTGAIIETNESGPWAIDCWWLLFGPNDRLSIKMPQGAPGEQAVVDWLVELPGFNHERMISAMGSTENAVFPVWRMPESQCLGNCSAPSTEHDR